MLAPAVGFFPLVLSWLLPWAVLSKLTLLLKLELPLMPRMLEVLIEELLSTADLGSLLVKTLSICSFEELSR